MGLTREIVARAVKDEAFRKRLVADPKATIAKEFDVELANDVTVRVHEDTRTVINLVIPAAPDLSAQRPLTPEQLGNVTGGLIASTPQLSTTRPLPGTQPGGLGGLGGGMRPRLSAGDGKTFGALTTCCDTGSFC